jgi:hypothetical protein
VVVVEMVVVVIVVAAVDHLRDRIDPPFPPASRGFELVET